MSQGDGEAAPYVEFRGRRFLVERGAQPPGPGAGLLVDVALEEGYGPVLEFGTGSGIVLLSLVASRYAASGVGVDESADALALARRNDEDLGVRHNSTGHLRPVSFRRGTLYDAVLMVGGSDGWAADVRDDERVSGYGATGGSMSPERFHLIVAALPEPIGTGVDVARRIAAEAEEHLERGGRVIVEVVPAEAGSVAEVFADAGLAGVEIRSDDHGVARVVLARHPIPR